MPTKRQAKKTPAPPRPPKKPTRHQQLRDIDRLLRFYQFTYSDPPLYVFTQELLAAIDPHAIFPRDSFEFMASDDGDWYMDNDVVMGPMIEWPTTIAMLEADAADLYRRSFQVLLNDQDDEGLGEPRASRVVGSMRELLEAAGCASDDEFEDHLRGLIDDPGDLDLDAVLVFEDENYMFCIGGPQVGGGMVCQAITFPTTLSDVQIQFRQFIVELIETNQWRKDNE